MKNVLRAAAQSVVAACIGDRMPKDCYESLLAKFNDGGFAKVLETKAESMSQLFCLLAWWLGLLRVQTPDAGPVFGTAKDCEDCEELLLLMTAEECVDCEPAMAGIMDGIRGRLIEMGIAYLLAMLADSDKVEAVLIDLARRIREALE